MTAPERIWVRYSDDHNTEIAYDSDPGTEYGEEPATPYARADLYAAAVAERDAARAEVERLRGPCTCGSGGHPRKCDAHPFAYEAHCAEMSLESMREELEAMRPVVEAAEGLTNAMHDDAKFGQWLLLLRAGSDLKNAVAAYRAAKDGKPEHGSCFVSLALKTLADVLEDAKNKDGKR